MKRSKRDVTSHYADSATARTYDADRYGGPVGRLFQEAEIAHFARLLGRVGSTCRIADIGAGTGKLRAVDPSAAYVGIDRSRAMLCTFKSHDPAVAVVVGDAVVLPLRDRSVDVVVASRVLMHVHDWRRMIAESCRIARRAVIVDFPVWPSLAAVEPLLWPAWRRDAHPPHRAFPLDTVRRCFRGHGFRQVAVDRGFTLPYRVHRLLGSARFTRDSEMLLRRIGATYLVGSPAFAAFSREAPADDGP